ncbi:hypothetical protein E2C01_017007 [Portunus trituberculatus]|uniref:Uncharacterized protein n=1 Tax=Portunus trituberculatus TaxID=210409 RepID=A0A5B7DR47_PORTR|nr:hypothetical protein [Portunus trituberculatus]
MTNIRPFSGREGSTSWSFIEDLATRHCFKSYIRVQAEDFTVFLGNALLPYTTAEHGYPPVVVGLPPYGIQFSRKTILYICTTATRVILDSREDVPTGGAENPHNVKSDVQVRTLASHQVLGSHHHKNMARRGRCSETPNSAQLCGKK